MIQPNLDNDLDLKAFNSKLRMFHNTHLVWNGYQICYGYNETIIFVKTWYPGVSQNSLHWIKLQTLQGLKSCM